MAKQPIRLSDHSACQCIQRARAAGRNLLIGKGLPFPIKIKKHREKRCFLVDDTGLEPVTSRTSSGCSYQLS